MSAFPHNVISCKISSFKFFKIFFEFSFIECVPLDGSYDDRNNFRLYSSHPGCFSLLSASLSVRCLIDLYRNYAFQDDIRFVGWDSSVSVNLLIVRCRNRGWSVVVPFFGFVFTTDIPVEILTDFIVPL